MSVNEINQEDAWTVIRAYFKQHGLVSQQISSYNQFVMQAIQQIVVENGEIQIPVEPQYILGNITKVNSP